MEKRQVSTNSTNAQSDLAGILEKHNVSHSASQQRSRGGLRFEVAIVCALPLEADAVISLFDAHLDENDGFSNAATQDVREEVSLLVVMRTAYQTKQPPPQGLGKASDASWTCASYTTRHHLGHSPRPGSRTLHTSGGSDKAAV